MADDARLPKVEAEADDEMHDPKDRRAASPLGEFLTACDPCADGGSRDPCLRKDFDDADEKAKDAQRRYGKVTRAAAILGCGALLFGLGEDLFGGRLGEEFRSQVFGIEVIYTLGTLVVVLTAILAKRQERWLNERFKAERLRLLKFKQLIDPRLWRSGNPDLSPFTSRLEADRRKIAHQTEEILDNMKISDALPELPHTQDCLDVEPSALQRLLEYYRRKRLGKQLEYFGNKVDKPLGWAANARLSPLFFFAGIACALCYFILSWATKGATTGRSELASPLLVFASIGFPLGWAGIRTWKSAHQAARNQARSHARYDALNSIDAKLSEATAPPPAQWDRPVIFGYLYASEAILSSDQYEWLRLMLDAEWYG